MSSRLAKKVLLVGWDAADWRVIDPLMDAGKLPALARLVEKGVIANLATLHPVLSPMLWTSIATGKRPFKHGILGFTEPTPDGARVRPVSSLSRKTKALWNILNQNGLRSSVVGWWPSSPVEPIDGVMVSNHYHRAHRPLDQPWPLPPGTVYPPRLEQTLAELRFHPSELIDEQLLPFIPRAAEIDQDKDRRLASVARILAECTSVHAAATWIMANEPWDLMAVYYDAIDHFCHGFMKYHPPRRDFIPERDYELYKGVVEAGYRFHDMMLGGLMNLAGDDTTVILVSDHGFHPDHNRPRQIPKEPAGPAIEHRDFGVFVMAGPGVKQDQLVHGACLLDVTPTILTLFGLPIGEDMDGKPLVQAFERPPAIDTLPSWDSIPGNAAMHPPEQQEDPLGSQEAMAQLVALGYVEKPDEDREKAVARTVRELRYNLARSYMDADLHARAVPILQELYQSEPDQYRFGVKLAMCYRALNRISEMRALVEAMSTRRRQQAREAAAKLKAPNEDRQRRRTEGKDADRPNDEEKNERRRLRSLARVDTFDLDYLMGYVNAAEGDHQAALEHLRRAEQAEPQRPGLHIQIGEAYLQLKRWDDAERSFIKALEIDPENPHVHLGLARSYLPRRKARLAAQAAIKSVSLLYHYPMAHYCLGQALARMGHYERAVDAFQVAVALNPNFKDAHRQLARLYERRLDDPAQAAEHRRLAEAIGQTPPAAADAVAETVVRPAAFDPRPARSVEPQDDQPFITVVTGLPRSGTSMMMQMLAAGGLPILTDGMRQADPDNPRGYYELEAATRLRRDRGWLQQAVGKGVKIVAQLLPCLPGGFRYRVIFMERDLNEVLASQRAMLERLGRKPADLPPERLREVFERQLRQVKIWLAGQPNVSTLFLSYREVLADPAASARTASRFLGGALPSEAMAQAVDSSLYRQKEIA